jgi:hypothetical protein
MAEWDKSRWYVMSELLDELLAADVVTLNPLRSGRLRRYQAFVRCRRMASL